MRKKPTANRIEPGLTPTDQISADRMGADIAGLLSRLAPGVRFLARRRLLLPALLFLSAHRPLAFVAGQGLWLCSPFDLLVPAIHLGDWAAVLSHPQGGAALEWLLEDILAGGSGVEGESSR